MFGADGTCSSASIAITGASTKPTRARAVEAALASKKLDETTLADAASHAAQGLELLGGVHGSHAYRGQLWTSMTRRAIMKSAGRPYGYPAPRSPRSGSLHRRELTHGMSTYY